MGNKFQDSTANYQVTWTNSTAQNTSLPAYGWGYSTAIITVQNTGTISGGAITFEGYDGYNWYQINATELLSGLNDQTYSLANGSVALAAEMTGFSQFRVRLSTAISGSGSVQITINESAAAISSIVRGSASVTNVQVTDGTNTVNVLKSDGTAAGQNAEIVAGTYLSVPFTTTTAQAVGSTDVGNYRWVSVHITTQGTGSLVTFQTSNDNVNWKSQLLYFSDSATAHSTSNTGSSNVIMYGALDARYFRLNVTGISAGTTAGTIVFSTLPGALQTLDVQQSGTWTVQPGNTANTTPWLVQSNQQTSKTYSASTNITPAASATDIFTITGNGTTTVFVTKIRLSGTQTTGGLVNVSAIKRSSADSGGTSSSVTAVPHDSNNAAASATLLNYSANPASTGTAVGTVRQDAVPFSASTATTNNIVEWTFGNNGQPMTLRGTAQQLALNLGGSTVTGGSINVDIEWYEV